MARKERIEVKTEYKRDLQNNYLILEAPDVDEEEHYGLRMARQNHVKGLLPVHESRRDGKLYLHYEITSKQTLESAYEKKVMGYQDILYILTGIRDALENMRKYLLSPQQLLFAPEMIYVQPERKELLLCYYVRENECPIRMLAEFILKRLDHRDRQAVALGYGFFERASGENFSLAETLKEILTTFEGTAGTAGLSAVSDIGAEGAADSRRADERTAMPYSERGNTEEGADGCGEWYEQSGKERFAFGVQEEPYVIHQERGRKDLRGEKDQKKKNSGKADRIFTKVHPAVLLSFLALTVILEILIISEILSLTESGGCFFLILSVEMLLNRRLLHKKNCAREEWDEEEETEEYRELMREVYQEDTVAADPDPVEETRCLIPGEENTVLHLVCHSHEEKAAYPEIHPEHRPVYIGKIKGDADVLLNVPTVSRMHARIQLRQGRCFLKDMNSKNGTFVNGRRLEPQEECEVQEGDIVGFAQIEYQAVKKNGIY